MKQISLGSWCGRILPAAVATILALAFIGFSVPAQAQLPVVQLSTDIFTNPQSQHATEVEPDTFAYGSTMVAAFQVGRIYGGGAAAIGFATTTDGGVTWINDYLPNLTVNYKNGKYAAASDPSVAYDAAHGVWLVATLGLTSNNDLVVSSSPDGINWNKPVLVDNQSGFADKDWIVCDSWPSSPFFGNCYVTWDDAFTGQVLMKTSTDGGQTWGAAKAPNGAFGLGGQPVVQPNGTVVVVFWGNGIQAFTSTNGGSSWSSATNVASVTDHFVAGDLRTLPLPSAEVDKAGKVYVVWQDCRFRTGCASNDIVMTKSKDGKIWSGVKRIPIDGVGSTKDHFIPGIAVDRNTKGPTAHLGLTYYFYPVANCTQATCKLKVGFVSSKDGGQTWSAYKKLSGPMLVTWLPDTSLGYMVGDYISTSYVNGKAFGVFAIAHQPTGGVFDEAMYTNATGLSAPESGAYFTSEGELPVPGARSDHGPLHQNILEHRHFVPPQQ